MKNLLRPENHIALFGVPAAIHLIALISLIAKLGLINLNWGEYTDGIIQLQLWDSPVVFFLPGYTAVVELFNLAIGDLLIAGRLVSILASVLAVYTLYSLAALVTQSPRAGFYACLFLALSPVFNRWSLRVMTDSLFCLLFIVACREFFLAWLNPKRPIAYLIGAAGLASLVRYQGLYFVPLIVFILFMQREGTARLLPGGEGRGEGKWFYTKRTLAYALAAIPWLLLVVWIALRGFGHHEQFIERGSYGFWVTLSAYYAMFETFILYWPWAITYSLFVVGVIGLVYRENTIQRDFARFFWVTAFIFLLAHSAFLSFQYRYLLPLVPLWCMAAGWGWCKCLGWLQNPSPRKICWNLLIANLLIMSTAVLFLQRSTFGDIAESAKALRVLGRDSRVLSDEHYREGVYNVKMEFWSGRKVHYLPQTQPRAGDIVVLHNAYSDLRPNSELVQYLRENFNVVRIKDWRSQTLWGDYSTLPLLPDIMVTPPSPPLTSNPPCMAFRFTPQHYYSIMVRLSPKL